MAGIAERAAGVFGGDHLREVLGLAASFSWQRRQRLATSGKAGLWRRVAGVGVRGLRPWQASQETRACLPAARMAASASCT